MKKSTAELPDMSRVQICYWGYAKGDPSIRVKAHTHDFYQMNFALSGSCIFRTASGDYSLKENEILLLSPGVQHSLHYPESHWGYTCKFYASLPDFPPVWHFPAGDFTKGIIQAAKTILETTFPTRFFGNPQGVVILPQDRYQTIMEYYLAGVLDACRQDQNYSPLPQEIRDYLNRHPSCLFSVSEAAEACHYSRNHFCVLIRQATGQSARDFLRSRRGEYAKRLLRYSSKSIGEIGEELGYSNQFHFSSFFREITGMSPREYRKSHFGTPETESGKIE